MAKIEDAGVEDNEGSASPRVGHVERLRVVHPLLTSRVGNGDPDRKTKGLLLR